MADDLLVAWDVNSDGAVDCVDAPPSARPGKARVLSELVTFPSGARKWTQALPLSSVCG